MTGKAFGTHNLAKNCNETLILASMFHRKKHGYELAREIETKSQGRFKFHHGTLYPILHRLEQEGWIRGEWNQDGPGRKRKYYALTARGKKYVQWQLSQWQAFLHFLFDIAGVVEE